jgi:hypothetical protein
MFRVSIAGSESTVRRWTDLVAPGKPIYKFKNANAYQGYVDSKKFVDIFVAKGISGPKTETLPWPTDVPPEFMVHFLRGLWDSDGSLSMSYMKDHPKWQLPEFKAAFAVKPKDFVRHVRDELVKSVGLHNATICEDVGTWKFSYGGISAKKVADYLYKDCPEHLRNEDRYNVYLRMCELQNEADSRICPCGEPALRKGMCYKCCWAESNVRITGEGLLCPCGATHVINVGLCTTCYSRKKRSESHGVPYEEALKRKCSTPSCPKRACFGKEQCKSCQFRKWKEPCPCGETKITALGLCKTCYENQRKAKHQKPVQDQASQQVDSGVGSQQNG